MIQFGRFLEAPFALPGKRLTEVMALPSFRLLKAEDITVDGEELLNIEFEFGDGTKKDTGVVTLDPANGWVIRHGEFKPSGLPGAKVITDIKYTPGPEGLPFPIRVALSDVDLRTYTCEFQDISFGPTQEHEFSSKHYGIAHLPNPLGESPPNYVPYWLFGIGAVGLSLALWLKRLADRKV
jgi:hypothetical protein